MAGQFGRATNQKAKQIKTVLAVCIMAILVLLVALVFSSAPQQEPKNESNGTAVAKLPEPVSVSNTVQVLTARQRIEQGAQIQPSMFTEREFDSDTVPAGAMLPNQLATITNPEQPHYAKFLINANEVLRTDSVTSQPPVSALSIPPGFRAVTINVNTRSGVAGYASPNSRVDVLWTYIGPDDQKRVATLIPFAKVLSVGGGGEAGETAPGARASIGEETPVTLLVTIQQGKKIELARTLGELTLSLVGDEETLVSDESRGEITIEDLIPDAREQIEELPADGVMYTTDPATGKKVRYLLRNGRWEPDER